VRTVAADDCLGVLARALNEARHLGSWRGGELTLRFRKVVNSRRLGVSGSSSQGGRADRRKRDNFLTSLGANIDLWRIVFPAAQSADAEELSSAGAMEIL